MSYLLRRRDGKMCCLGQLGEACGISKTALLGKLTPTDRFKQKNISKWPLGLIEQSPTNFSLSIVCAEMVTVNDNPNITDAKREPKLAKLFKRIGVEVTFQ